VESQDDARFELINREQVVLEPLDIELLIPPEHAARSIWAILGRLDLSRFLGEVKAVKGHAGRNRWEPRLLIALWIYAYSRGISSAREIERQLAYEPAMRWLTGLKIVNHHTLSDFRVEHGAALQDLFAQVLGILSMEKLITLERVTVDGTKVRASVSKKTFSRAAKIDAHLSAARAHLEALQSDEAEQEKRARHRAARQRAARERVERLDRQDCQACAERARYVINRNRSSADMFPHSHRLLHERAGAMIAVSTIGMGEPPRHLVALRQPDIGGEEDFARASAGADRALYRVSIALAI